MTASVAVAQLGEPVQDFTVVNENGTLTALSGLEGQQEKLVSVVAHQLLFFVPGKDSGEKMQLLGYTSDLVSASNS